MNRAMILLCLLPLGCPAMPDNTPQVEAQGGEDSVHARLIRALEEGNGQSLNRGEVAEAWRAVTDEEWERWDTNDDDVLDRDEIAELTKDRDKK